MQVTGKVVFMSDSNADSSDENNNSSHNHYYEFSFQQDSSSMMMSFNENFTNCLDNWKKILVGEHRIVFCDVNGDSEIYSDGTTVQFNLASYQIGSTSISIPLNKCCNAFNHIIAQLENN